MPRQRAKASGQCGFCKRPLPGCTCRYEPSEEDIRRECEAIRKSWSRKRRRKATPEPVSPELKIIKHADMLGVRYR